MSPPDDYFQSFIRAGELGFLSPGLAEKLAPSAGPRNRLVHEYDQIAHSIILKASRWSWNIIRGTLKRFLLLFPARSKLT